MRSSIILNKNGQVDIIYTDLTKVFNRIDISYLTIRKQYKEFLSRYVSGMPQGSILEPLLFIIYKSGIVCLLFFCTLIIWNFFVPILVKTVCFFQEGFSAWCFKSKKVWFFVIRLVIAVLKRCTKFRNIAVTFG